MQPFEVAFVAVIAFAVLGVAALANGSKLAALFFALLTVMAWGAYISMMPA